MDEKTKLVNRILLEYIYRGYPLHIPDPGPDGLTQNGYTVRYKFKEKDRKKQAPDGS